MKSNNSIMDCNQEYDESFNTFCYQNCMKHILSFYEIENSEFYINKTMGCCIKKNEDLAFDLFDEESARSVLPYFANKAKRYRPENDDCMDVFLDNVQKIKSGLPLIVGVDSYYLPYMPYYQKSHGKHTVIMADYDGSEISVIDWMAPWFYKGKVSKKTFIEARNSENPYDGGVFSGDPICNNWAEIERNGWDWSIQKLIMYSIKLSLDQYYNPVSIDGIYRGIETLGYIQGKLGTIEDALDETDQKELLKKLHTNLYKFGFRRVLWKDFLEKTNNIYESKKIEELILSTTETIDKWEKLLYLIIKKSLRIKNGYSKVLDEKFREIINLEIDNKDILREFYEENNDVTGGIDESFT